MAVALQIYISHPLGKSQYFVPLPSHTLIITILYIMCNQVLPQDPAMLYSFINMKLRDRYASLDALCEDLDVERAVLEDKLAAAGFEYSAEHNKFW